MPDRDDAIEWGALPARVLIRADGSWEELDDARGPAYLASLDGVSAYAQRLIELGLKQVTFAMVDKGRPWTQVSLRALRGEPGRERVVVAEFEELSPPPYSLTRRELDVLTLIVGGLSNSEISARLFTSKSTVSTQVESVLEKLGQRSRTGAAALAIEQGLVRLPIPGGTEGFEHVSIGLLEGAEPRALPVKRHHVEQRPLLVGLAVPSEDGQIGERDATLNGTQLAIDEVNARGGIGGRSLASLTVDVDIESLDDIKAGFNTLVSQEVDAVLVPYTFVEHSSIYTELNDYGCPVLTAQGSERQAEWVHEDPATYGRIFQIVPTESFYGTRFLHTLQRLVDGGHWQPPNRRIAWIETSIAGGHVAEERTVALAGAMGWEIDGPIEVPNNHVDWKAVVEQIRRDEPAAVMLAHFVPREAAIFTSLFGSDAPRSLLYVLYAPSSKEFTAHDGASFEGLVWATMAGTYADAMGNAFIDRYVNRYGETPGQSLAGIAYDKVDLIARVWGQVENPRSFGRVADALRQVVHRGVTGVYSLGGPRQAGVSYPDETPDPSMGQAHLTFQVQHGVSKIIDPPIYASSVFVQPQWLDGGGRRKP